MRAVGLTVRGVSTANDPDDAAGVECGGGRTTGWRARGDNDLADVLCQDALASKELTTAGAVKDPEEIPLAPVKL